MQEVEGSTPAGGTCPNDFSDPIDQDITQWALSWKIVVTEWRSVIAVSLNVGGGVRLIKSAKLCMCTQNTTNTTRTDARRRVCAAMVSYRWATRGTSLRELEYTHIHTHIFFVLISFPVFLFQFLFCYILERKDKKWFKRDIIVLISFLILFVSISFLINIGKEMSLPGFRI